MSVSWHYILNLLVDRGYVSMNCSIFEQRMLSLQLTIISRLALKRQQPWNSPIPCVWGHRDNKIQPVFQSYLIHMMEYWHTQNPMQLILLTMIYIFNSFNLLIAQCFFFFSTWSKWSFKSSIPLEILLVLLSFLKYSSILNSYS